MKKRVLTFSVFLFLVVGMLFGLNWVLTVNKVGEPGMYAWTAFDGLEKDSVDVLVLGSSHAYCDIDAAVLYENYGIAAYDLCGSAQRMWNSYYNLKQALITQKPKAIVLDLYALTMDKDYSISAKANTLGFPLSYNRFADIWTSVEPKERIHFFMPWMLYHGRYNELTQTDFEPWLGWQDSTRDCLGMDRLWTTHPFDDYSVTPTQQTQMLDSENEAYYRKVLELAQQNHIAVMAVVMPYVGADAHTAYYNQAQAIAQEYGITFVNYNLDYDTLDIDFAEDFRDEGHVNYRGAVKCSNAVGELLSQNLSLPDRRGDASYGRWQRNADYYNQCLRSNQLHETQNMAEYCDILAQGTEQYTVVAAVGSAEMAPENSKLLQQLKQCDWTTGNTVVLQGGNLIYEGPCAQEIPLTAGGTDWALKQENSSLVLRSKSAAQIVSLENTDVSFIIIDDQIQQIVDVVSFDAGGKAQRAVESQQNA